MLVICDKVKIMNQMCTQLHHYSCYYSVHILSYICSACTAREAIFEAKSGFPKLGQRRSHQAKYIYVVPVHKTFKCCEAINSVFLAVENFSKVG